MDMKTTCLGALLLGDASGYEIKKHFEEGPFSHFADGGYGSIYPALNKLTEEGLATCYEETQSKRPSKKIYQITEKGREALAEGLAKEPNDDKFKSDFLFNIFFADCQSPERMEKLIDTRIHFYKQLLELLKSKMPNKELKDCHRVGPVFTLGYGIASYQFAMDYLIENKDILINALQEKNKTGTNTHSLYPPHAAE